jgi:6-phosphogluconolactonase
MLPFDHRGSFKKGLFGWTGDLSPEQMARIAEAKRIIYDAALAAIASGVPRDRVSILVDEPFGAAILADAHDRGIATACPVEKSGQAEFDFEHGEDFASHIEAMNPTYVKALVRYNPGGDAALNARQAARLRRLSDYVQAARRRLLVELLVPPEPWQLVEVDGDAGAYDLELRPALLTRAMRELQDAGIEPHVWKLEGLERRDDGVEVGRTARRGGRGATACIVLGRAGDDTRVLRWLEVAASIPEFEGFAAGRSTFWEALKAVIAERVSRPEAVARIAGNFRRWIDAWESARRRAGAEIAGRARDEVEVYSDHIALVHAEAERIVGLAWESIFARGQFALALSGGSTPRPLYELLATPPFRDRIDWSRVHVFFGDERCVPRDHPESNFRMACQALLDHVPLPRGNVHRIRGEDPPEAAARAYEELLRGFFGAPDADAPRTFDLTLLGMGDDGHVASLYPATDPSAERGRWVVATRAERRAVPARVTLTPACINGSADVTFLVAGARKAARLKEVLEGGGRRPVVSAQLIRPREGTLHWMLDAAAASLLPKGVLGASSVKLVVADIDGTLVTRDKVLTARAVAAVAALRDAGIAFTVTSGRPPRGMRAIAERLSLSAPVAAFNGGMLLAPDLRTILEQRTLPNAVAVEVVERLLAAGLDAWVYRGDEWYVRDPGAARVEHEQSTVRFAPTVVRDLRPVLDGVVKIVGVSQDLPLVARCEGELRETMGANVWAGRSQPYYLDVTHPDANKGTVVRELAERLAVPLSAVATIGDMPTDVLMFGLSRVSIAMGNATPEVQRCARYVTTPNEEEGFANAMERFVLGRALPRQAKLGLPPRTRACLFDLDGVLTKTATIHAAAWKQAFDDFLAARSRASGEKLVPFDALRDYENYVDGKPRVEGVRSFLAARGIELPEGLASDPPGSPTLHGLGNRKNEILLDLLRRHPAETFEGSIRYVNAARSCGLRTAVVSSSKNCQAVLASAGISDLFDARIDGVVAQEHHLHGKPAPDTFLAAADALGVEPGQAAVFEDALAGVEAGRAGHFGYVIGVDRLGQAVELRRHGADLVVSDLAALL